LAGTTDLLGKQFFIPLFLLLTSVSFAQNGKLVLNGNVTKEGQPLAEAEIKIFKIDGGLKFSYANNVGKFVASLELNTEYVVSVSEKGYATRSITVMTKVPASATGDHAQNVTIDLRKLCARGNGWRCDVR
jgi:hypothetical protein